MLTVSWVVRENPLGECGVGRKEPGYLPTSSPQTLGEAVPGGVGRQHFCLLQGAKLAPGQGRCQEGHGGICSWKSHTEVGKMEALLGC